MSYGKKDEDADLGLVKVDRTQVFQEGELPTIALASLSPPTTAAGLNCRQHVCSTVPRSNLDDAAFS